MIVSESLRLRLAAGLKLHLADQRRNGLAPSDEVLDLLDLLLSGHEGTELVIGWRVSDAEGVLSWTGAVPAAVDAESAARLLGVSVKTVRRRIAAGTLPSSRVGRRVLIPRDVIDEVVRGRRVA